MLKVLITGASSLLGKAFLATSPKDCEISQTWFTNYVGIPMYQMNVCDKLQVGYIFDRCQPDVVIHCAAIGTVDYAEKNPKEVYEVNFNGTLNVLNCAKRYSAKFVYISTNAVYDGTNPPYNENSHRNPINKYGLIKKQAEDAVSRLYDNYLIIRPFLLYGWPYHAARQTWVQVITKRLMEGHQIKLVNDVYWQPTLAEEVARIGWILINGEYIGESFNIASPDRMTLYEFGKLIAKCWYLHEELILPASASEFASLAPRPVDTTYDTSKLNQLGITIKGTEKGLRDML